MSMSPSLGSHEGFLFRRDGRALNLGILLVTGMVEDQAEARRHHSKCQFQVLSEFKRKLLR